MTALVIHGHFYQPPRENPWTGEVEPEPGAAPYHDWNERIHAEAYAPNVNNYPNISFNFGPTLLSWLERHHPETYQKILDADKASAAKRSGHGNAIAQAYGHAILPLCNGRDRLTQVVWGLADFRFRFGREAEALWLPETAANDDVLSLLIDQGMRYVILSPEQAKGKADTSKPYLFRHSDRSGRSLTVFFYNGPLARAIAFEKALTSSRGLVDQFIRAAQSGAGDLVHVATDGETFGHHFKFGDLCLSHALDVEARKAGFWITNYGEYLDRHPAELEVEIENGPEGEGSSWSCAHGVGRWTRDCGCQIGGEPGYNQSWRAPLRAAFNFLRDDTASKFESGDLLRDPWAARNDYIRVILDPQHARKEFLTRHAVRLLSDLEAARVWKLLEMQRSALLMFTSCGWFFHDLAGIETLQVMRYAARVIDLQNELGLQPPQKRFLELMAEAKSNKPEKGNGADIFLRLR
jgi:alpha-amylase/alpha-mannosidase (GH57 family)